MDKIYGAVAQTREDESQYWDRISELAKVYPYNSIFASCTLATKQIRFQIYPSEILNFEVGDNETFSILWNSGEEKKNYIVYRNFAWFISRTLRNVE